MMKSTLLKSALTVIAAFAIGSAYAQNPPSILTAYADTNEDIYQTTGVSMRVYALPDLVYSPSYAAATNTGMNTNSRWRWVYGADWATGTQIKDWTDENFVDITPIADMVIRVKEKFDIGCESATDQTINVKCVAQPSITAIAAQGSGSWVEVTAGLAYKYCGEGIGDVIDVTIAEAGVLAAMKSYTYGVTVQSATGDMNGAWNPLANNATLTVAANTANLTDGTTITVPALDMVDNADGKPLPTKYVYSITPSSLSSKTSCISHYRSTYPTGTVANTPYNNVPGTTITYYLYPTPTTGPIYHIANNFTY